MAARIRASHQDEVRAKIQASQLINRVYSAVMGEVELTSVQMTGALGLLKKVLPDLSATTLASDPQNPLIARIERKIVDPRNPDS